MKNLKKNFSRLAFLLVSVLWMFCLSASADEYNASDDNYLSSLGLGSDATCSPDFNFATLEYNVTVPAGTKTLELHPETSAYNANIVDISGTDLDENGNGTVSIVVESENGVQLTYVLNVTAEGAAAAVDTTAETETMDAQAVAESEARAESERLAAESEAEAQKKKAAEMEAKAAQVDLLQKENDDFAYRIGMLMKILYGMIALCVILLFMIINQNLRNKDLKDELKTLKSHGADSYDFARRDDNVRNDFYYTPVQNQPQQPYQGNGQMTEAPSNIQETFGTAPQVLKAQPMEEMPAAEPELSKKEQRRLEKEAKKNAKKAKAQAAAPQQEVPMQPMPEQPMPEQPMPQQPMPQQPMQQMPPQETVVQSTVEEPDVDVDMIDL